MDGLGIPLELFTGLGSALLAGYMTLRAKAMEHERQRNELLLKRASASRKAATEAREFQGSKGFQFTRRVIALMAVFSILVLPKLAAIFTPEISVTVGTTLWKPGFLFLTEGRETVEWVTTTGLTLTPLDTHTVMAIVGMYFGASIVKNA